jgi:hypothetical protein
MTNVVAQGNQLPKSSGIQNQQRTGRRSANGTAGIGGAVIVECSGGSTIRAALSKHNAGVVSSVRHRRQSLYGHFWAPMSKWMISGSILYGLAPTDGPD